MVVGGTDLLLAPRSGLRPTGLRSMKVLVIRFSSIGDIILTSPVLRCLKAQRPEAEIHFLTKAVYRDLVAHSPHVAQVHTITEEVGEAIPALKREGFTEVIDLHHNLRSWKVKRALGVPAHSFPKLNIEKWLLVNQGHFERPQRWKDLPLWKRLLVVLLPPIWIQRWVDTMIRDRINSLGAQHIVDRYLRTVEHLGVRNDGLGLELHLPAEATAVMNDLPATHVHGYVALCIGAAHSTKRLPAHKLVAIAQAVHGPLVIIGGKEDQPVARTIADAVGARAYNATGRYDLAGSAALIRQARSVIAHDSGAMHVACAFQRPVVSVWGSTVPLFGMGPYMPQHPERARILEVQDLSCRPCSKIGFDHCPKGHFHCMEKQDTARIAALANNDH